MARSMALVISETSSFGPAEMDLADVPQDVRDDVEDAYKICKANPTGRIRGVFETKTELNQFYAQATAYCAQRPAGAIRIRKSPTKGLTDNVMDFKVTDLKTPTEEATEQVREATAAANAPAKAAKRTAKAAA